ncbi:hypothetical protein JOC77_002973 [Peribacillus deserti]|uniref:Uncharacterized protein n=1 Tax=Peribacillus deserti TaxID=673318 RepID=A0ABS2QM43_9BACI|nr:hypothetical protein [Peribacillus deserti]MBM7693533.1 hypothetical protein [Peribacillus deserti]
MGHYISAYDTEGKERAAIGYSVWDSNVKLLYKALGQRELGPDDWSGDNSEVVFSHKEIFAAVKRIEESEFFSEVQYDELHPLIRIFTEVQQPTIDVEKEKGKLEQFLNGCLVVAAMEGQVKINFG